MSLKSFQPHLLRAAGTLLGAWKALKVTIAQITIAQILKKILKTRFGHWRVSRVATRIFGVQYRRALRKIEIDITYACNLTCHNCNRSCGQAPTGQRMSLEQIEWFLTESILRKIKWDRIRLLGGEPTLHPDFEKIIEAILGYRDSFSERTVIQIATNGYGRKVEAVLKRIPPGVQVHNTRKIAGVNPEFDTFNIAPKDLKKYERSDFRNACSVTSVCGTALSSSGYYPCAVAAGIDRVLGWDLGRQSLPSDSDMMEDVLQKACSHCGHFKRNLGPLVSEPVTSPAWVDAYVRYKNKAPHLTLYGRKVLSNISAARL
jgi:Radical SAM superfamily